MPAAAMSWIAPSLIGGLGLLQSAKQAKDASKVQNAGLSLTKLQGIDMQKMMQMADAYDPHADTTTAVNRAQDVAGSTLQRSLTNLIGNFASGGATPGSTSEWGVRSRNAEDAVMDPLKQFVADQSASEFTRKLNAYRMAAGGNPSDVADQYFKAAQQMPQTDPSGSLKLLLQGLQGAFSQKKTSSGPSTPSGSTGPGDLPPSTHGMSGMFDPGGYAGTGTGYSLGTGAL